MPVSDECSVVSSDKAATPSPTRIGHSVTQPNSAVTMDTAPVGTEEVGGDSEESSPSKPAEDKPQAADKEEPSKVTLRVGSRGGHTL